MLTKRLPPIHPGEILFEEFLYPMNITKYRLAKLIHVPAQRIGEIIKGNRAITADTALRLSRFFKNSKEFWLGLQMHYDLEVAEDKLAKKIGKEIQPYEDDAA